MVCGLFPGTGSRAAGRAMPTLRICRRFAALKGVAKRPEQRRHLLASIRRQKMQTNAARVPKRYVLTPALFGNSGSEGVVPIAYFSEFRCPYCRALERDLDTLMADYPASFRLVQHELPIFGPASELAARASVAAAKQGKQPELRRRFMRTPLVAEEASVLRVAADIGLDVDRLAKDMASAEVQEELDRTRALADVFGFIGTPGLVIGRTVLNGAIPYALLRRIVEDEAAQAAPVC